MSEPIRDVKQAVAELGALPVPVGPEPQPLGAADELAAYRALDLGDPDGRVSATCGKPNHPTWLRKVDDTRACPWCVMDLQNESLVARTHQLAHYQEIERNFWANQRADQSLAAVANLRIAELSQERDALQARVAELEAAPKTVFRAEHPDSGITLGLYGTEAAARAHCEDLERRSWPTGTTLAFDWIEDDEDRVAELVVTAGQNEESTTGYVVTALDAPSEYDEEADE